VVDLMCWVCTGFGFVLALGVTAGLNVWLCSSACDGCYCGVRLLWFGFAWCWWL